MIEAHLDQSLADGEGHEALRGLARDAHLGGDLFLRVAGDIIEPAGAAASSNRVDVFSCRAAIVSPRLTRDIRTKTDAARSFAEPVDIRLVLKSAACKAKRL